MPTHQPSRGSGMVNTPGGRHGVPTASPAASTRPGPWTAAPGARTPSMMAASRSSVDRVASNQTQPGRPRNQVIWRWHSFRVAPCTSLTSRTRRADKPWSLPAVSRAAGACSPSKHCIACRYPIARLAQVAPGSTPARSSSPASCERGLVGTHVSKGEPMHRPVGPVWRQPSRETGAAAAPAGDGRQGLARRLPRQPPWRHPPGPAPGSSRRLPSARPARRCDGTVPPEAGRGRRRGRACRHVPGRPAAQNPPASSRARPAGSPPRAPAGTRCSAPSPAWGGRGRGGAPSERHHRQTSPAAGRACAVSQHAACPGTMPARPPQRRTQRALATATPQVSPCPPPPGQHPSNPAHLLAVSGSPSSATKRQPAAQASSGDSWPQGFVWLAASQAWHRMRVGGSVRVRGGSGD